MKTKAASAGFLKQVISLVMSVVKAKAMAVKSKTSAVVKTRLVIFGLLRNNKKVLMSAVSHKIHALLGHQQQGMKQGRRGSGGGGAADDVDDSKAVVLYSAVPADHDAETAAADPEVAGASAGDADHGRVMAAELSTVIHHINGAVAAEEEEYLEEEDDDGYPDLRHSLFDEEEEEYYGLLQGDDGTRSVVELVKNLRGEEEGEFVLEDEIDHVADVFIRRFHRQMRMQKLESFKRFHEMMERSV